MIDQDAISKLIDTHLMSEEGFRLYAYDDRTGKTVTAPVGKLTIGIGWNIQDTGCPLDLAKTIAAYFIQKFDAELSKTLEFYETLDDVRKCVLIDMAYNMGIAGTESFNASLNLIGQGFYKNAAIQMRRSAWYSEVPIRAETLCMMMETGEWINAK